MKKVLFYLKKYYFYILIFILLFFDVDEYLDITIPHLYKYIFGILILSTLWSLIQKKQISRDILALKNSIYLTTSNDYSRKAMSLIFSLGGIILCVLLFLNSTYFEKLTLILAFTYSSLLFLESLFTSKSLRIIITNDQLIYQVEKIKKTFNIDELQKIELSNTVIIFTKKDIKKHELSFLETTNKDINIAIRFLKTKLGSDIIVTSKE